MTTIHSKIAVVTGAASGLGRALAIALAARGAHLALSDINEPGLRETEQLVRRADRGTRISQHLVDVGDRSAVEQFAAAVEREHGGVDLVFNNAGVGLRASIETLTYEDLTRVLSVNLWGVIYGTKVFLPMLRRRPEGHIINIGSVNSFVPFPESGAYNTSKFAVLGWSETLQQELRGTRVRVTCVHPGAVRTNIVRNSRGFTAAQAEYFDSIAKMTSSFAAERTLRAVESNREQVIIGRDAQAIMWIKRIAPQWTLRFVADRLLAGRAVQTEVSSTAS